MPTGRVVSVSCSTARRATPTAPVRAAAYHGSAGIYNAVDDGPAPIREWVPYIAEILGAPPPATASAESAEPDTGHQAVYYGTQLRGASNAKARRELGFSPLFPDWRGGFQASLADTT